MRDSVKIIEDRQTEQEIAIEGHQNSEGMTQGISVVPEIDDVHLMSGSAIAADDTMLYILCPLIAPPPAAQTNTSFDELMAATAALTLGGSSTTARWADCTTTAISAACTGASGACPTNDMSCTYSDLC
jgi:hypothetical protein